LRIPKSNMPPRSVGNEECTDDIPEGTGESMLS